MALFPLGILSAAGAGGPAFDSDYELITSQILGLTSDFITFTSISTYASTYKHLQLRYVVRGSDDNFLIRLNGVSSASYATHRLVGNGSGVSSSNAPSNSWMWAGITAPNSTASGVFSGGVIDFLDIYNNSKNKTIRTLSGYAASANNVNLASGFFNSTAAITSIDILGSIFAVGSRFSLYGIKG
jgi:hypothetical protein